MDPDNYTLVLCIDIMTTHQLLISYNAGYLYTMNSQSTYLKRLLSLFHLLFSGILQPQREQHLRRWSPCTVCSFESEPEPSGAKVSPAIHVLHLNKCIWRLQCTHSHYIVQCLIFEEHDPHNFADMLQGRILLNFRSVESDS